MATSGDTSSSPEEHPLDAGEPAYQSNPTFQKRGKARLAAKLVAVLLVIGLIIPLLLGLPTLQHGKKARDDNQPDRLPAAPWKTYLDVKESTVIKDRSLTVGGDILIRRGAELDLVNCSVVMNGTFYAEGRLSLTRTTIRDFEPDYGYSWHFYDWPAITTNLTGCRQARFDFNYTGQLYAPVWIDVVRDGTRTQRIWNTSYMGDEVESASVDLSPFCGGIVELDFCSTATLSTSGGSSQMMGLIGPRIIADTFTTGPQDLIVCRPEQTSGSGFYSETFLNPYMIRGNGGDITIDNSTLERHPNGGMLLEATDSHVRITNTDFGLAFTSIEYSYGLAHFEGCTLEMTGSTANGTGGISMNGTRAQIRDCNFLDGRGAISARNSDMVVVACRIDDHEYGIDASIDMPGRLGSARIEDCAIKAADSGIGICNLTAAVRGCNVTAHVPLYVCPRSSLTKSTCTLENVISMSGNRLNAFEYLGDQCPTAAVVVFSEIPVTGMEMLASANELNGTRMVERDMRFDTEAQPLRGFGSNDVLLYNSTGRVEEIGPSLQPIGERSFSDGWQMADQSYNIMGVSWWEGGPSWHPMVPVEWMGRSGTSFLLYHLDDKRIEVWIDYTELPRGEATFDASAARHPQDIIVLEPGGFRPYCDLMLSNLEVSYDRVVEKVNISAIVSIDGEMDNSSSRVVCTLEGRTLYDSIMPAQAREISLTEDLANMSSGGELTLSVIPTDGNDTDISNNIVRAGVHMLDRSEKLSGAQDLAGLWLLGPGVDLSFDGCNASARNPAFVTGLGDNNISFSSSVLNVTALSLEGLSGRFEDCDIRAASTDSSVTMNYPDRFLEINGGAWDISNTTAGLNKSETDLEFWKSFGFLPSFTGPRPYLLASIAADKLTIDNSSFLVALIAFSCPNSSITVRNSLFLLESSIEVDCRDLEILDSRFEMINWMSLCSNESSIIKNNSFFNILGRLDVFCTNQSAVFIGNSVDFDFPWDLYPTGLNLGSNGTPAVQNNTFSGLGTGIFCQNPGGFEEISEKNQFKNISIARVSSGGHLSIEIDSWNLSLMLNRQVTGIHLFWNDSTGAHDAQTWAYPGRRLAYAYADLMNSSIGPDGIPRQVEDVEFNIVVESASGLTYSFTRTVRFSDDPNWTEKLG